MTNLTPARLIHALTVEPRLTYREIATIYGVHINTISMRAKLLQQKGLVPPRYGHKAVRPLTRTALDQQTLVRDGLGQGKTQTQIAREIGVSSQRISQIVRAL